MPVFATDLLAEHLGTDEQTVANHFDKSSSIIATINALGNEHRSLKDLPTSVVVPC